MAASQTLAQWHPILSPALPAHLHAEDVERLAPDVLGAHVDDALQAQQRARRGGGDAVLPRARLRDDALLADALGNERLPQRVVELVRARVRQLLTLQPDLACKVVAWRVRR